MQKFAFTTTPIKIIAMLSEGKFSPITTTIGFIEAKPLEVATAFYDWQAPLFRKTTSPLEIEALDSIIFEEAMGKLSLLTSRASRWIFLPAGSSYTAMFSNCARGLDPSPISPLAVKRCGTKGFRVTATKRSHRGKKYSSRIVEAFSPDSSEPFNCERSIYCANDGGKWKFGSTGNPYSFENLVKYELQPVKERFTIGDLKEFMMHFQIDVDSESFYGGDGQNSYQVFMKGELLPNMREYFLSEIT